MNIEELRTSLLNTNKNGYTRITAEQRADMEAYCKRYMAFMDAAKTEREATTWAIAEAEKYGFKPEEMIGMFIPNTYEVWWNITPEGLTERMKKEYDNFWNEERVAKLARTRLTQKEVTTLASIICEETRMTDEMPTMAGVYINRLRRGMLLQADPTVKFAIGDFTIRRVLNRHLEVDSPYNTYKYAGLPPSPICMPSIKGIDAVLNYKESNYLYFCAKEDFSGYHNFARTLSEHNQNARRYANALNRAGIR